MQFADMVEPTRVTEREGPEGDLVLVERVLAGDRRAFESLVRRHERRVFRVTLAVLGNIEDAEEAMQDTFVKSFRHLDQFRKEARRKNNSHRSGANRGKAIPNSSMANKKFIGSSKMPSSRCRRFIGKPSFYAMSKN